MAEDDVWYSSEESDGHEDAKDDTYGDGNPSATLTLRSLKREHAKQGYLDGLTKSREASLQEGFDDGYPVGARIGDLVGKLIVNAATKLEEGTLRTQQYQQELRDLGIATVLQGKYFDANLDLPDEKKHPLLEKRLDE